MPNSDESRSLAERIEVVERLLAETPAEEGVLADKIDQFGVSAESLAKALLVVDKSQRELILLKRRVANAETDKADKHVVVEQVRAVEDASRKEISRLRGYAFSAAIIAVGLLGATVFAFTMYAKAKSESNDRYAAAVQRVCQQRSEQSRIMGKYLTDQMNRIKKDPHVPASQKALAEEQAKVLRTAFPVIDCSRLTYR